MYRKMSVSEFSDEDFNSNFNCVKASVYFFIIVGLIAIMTYMTGSSLYPAGINFTFGTSKLLEYSINFKNLFFELIVPIVILYFVINKIYSYLKETKTTDTKKQKYTTIYDLNLSKAQANKYSICLSIDYDYKKKLTKEKKDLFNQIIYSKIKVALKNTNQNCDVTILKNVLIITSENFYNYDKIYEALLKILSNQKNNIKNKFDLELIATISTDAYLNQQNPLLTQRKHFNIQNCNFKNKACTTESFANKYKSLKQNKYAGVPIGKYVLKEKTEEDNLDLNIVYKNLSKKLAEL